MISPESRDREIDISDPRLARLRSMHRYWQDKDPNLATCGLFEFLREYVQQHPHISVNYPFEGKYNFIASIDGLVPVGDSMGIVVDKRAELMVGGDFSVKVFTHRMFDEFGVYIPEERNFDFKEVIAEGRILSGQVVEAIRDAFIVAGFDKAVGWPPRRSYIGDNVVAERGLGFQIPELIEGFRPPLLNSGRDG